MLNRLLILLIGIAFVGCGNQHSENKNEKQLESKLILLDTIKREKKLIKSKEILDSLVKELESKKSFDDSLTPTIKEAEPK